LPNSPTALPLNTDALQGAVEPPGRCEGRIRKTIHIDMDAFYASVEQRDEPTLKGKPVAVGYPAKPGALLRRATRREVSEFARRCRQRSRFGSAPNPCLFRLGSTFTAKVFKQSHAVFKDYTRLVAPLSLSMN
jgi:DNA polymerase-4